MANLQSYQTKLTVGRLFRIKKDKISKPTSNVWFTIQGVGTVDVYVAEDGATPDTNPANLAAMGKTITGSVVSQSMEGNHNFISFQQNGGTNTVYVSGAAVEDLGAIS